MKLHSTLLAACASLALGATGCLVGDIDDPTPPEITDGPINGGDDPSVAPPATGTQDPQALFAQVVPALEATCGTAGIACHAKGGNSPDFIGANADETYTLIKNFKDILFRDFSTVDSKLLEYGDGSQHKGTTYDTAQVQAIQNWLAAEAAKPIDDAPSPLAVWSGCMDLQEFSAAGVADAWADKGTNEGNCDACHNLGADGFIASNVDVRVFDAVTKDPGFMLSYFTLDPEPTAIDKVIINRARLEKVATGVPPHQGHPRFNVDGGNAMQRLQNFYDQTKQKMAAGTCLPPRFGQPL